MNGPPRLRDSGVEGRLLAAFDDDRPSAEARSRMGAALGVGAATAAGGTVALAAQIPASSALPPATASTGSSLGIVTKAGTLLAGGSIKWGAALVLLGAMGGGALIHGRHEAPAASAPPAAASAVHAPVAPATPAEAPAMVPSPSVSSAERTASASEPPPPVHAGHAAPAEASSAVPSLSAELASLERVRRAVDAGEGRRALAELGEYRHRYPNGTLALEAEYLRIESLIGAGDRGPARSAAHRFLASHPAAPQVRRVQSLLRMLESR